MGLTTLTDSFVSAPLLDFPLGHAMANVFATAIPAGISKVVNIVAAPPIQLTGATIVGGAFQFGFTNIPNASFTVLASSDISLPTTNWTVLGSATEISPGQYQFSNPQALNNPQRFYRVRLP